MKQYKTLGTVTLSDGLVELTPSQATRRAGSLTRKGATKQYTITKPIQIKSGEVVGLSTAPKGMEAQLSEVKRQVTKKAES